MGTVGSERSGSGAALNFNTRKKVKMKAFDWVEFPKGRARFSGAVGYIFSWNELPHETFCVEMNGQELFGEVKAIFSENGNNYNLEIVSFGYKDKGNVGAPVDESWVVAVTKIQAQQVTILLRKLISIASELDDPPFVLGRAKELFLGGINFKDGWVRLKNSDAQYERIENGYV
jgi:hypothetical protein